MFGSQSNAQIIEPTLEQEAAGMRAAQKFSKDCGHDLLDADPHNSGLWSDCMKSFIGFDPTPPKTPLTTVFRNRNIDSNLYLTRELNPGKKYGRPVSVGKAEANRNGDLWALQRYEGDFPIPLGRGYQRSYWRNGKASPNLFYIINLSSGLVLASTPRPVDKYTPLPRYLQERDPVYLAALNTSPVADFVWELDTIDGVENDFVGNGVAHGTRTMLYNWRTQKGTVSSGVSKGYHSATGVPNVTPTTPQSIWVLEDAGQMDLAKIDFKSVKAIRTSTGQDKNTRAMFEGIQAAVEYGPGIATGGASVGAMVATQAKHLAATLAKKVATKVAQKAAQKIAKVAAARAAKKTAAKTVGGLARHEAKLAATKASQETAKVLGKIVSK